MDPSTGQAVPSPDANARTLALRALFDDHFDDVYRYVHRRCGDHALAEDVTQDVFVAVARGERDPAGLSFSWLVTVARNRLIDILRRSDRYEAKLRLVRGGLVAESAVEGGTVDRLTMAQAWENLSADHRLVLALRYLDGQSIDELAVELGRSRRGIEGLIARARKALADALEEHRG